MNGQNAEQERILRVLPGSHTRIDVPPGYIFIGELIKDRRTGAATRRARGFGQHPEFKRRIIAFGRRIDDKALQAERRVAINAFRPTSDNPLGRPRWRRKSDERRDPDMNFSYTSSRDSRVRALERRQRQSVSPRFRDFSEKKA